MGANLTRDEKLKYGEYLIPILQSLFPGAEFVKPTVESMQLEVEGRQSARSIEICFTREVLADCLVSNGQPVPNLRLVEGFQALLASTPQTDDIMWIVTEESGSPFVQRKGDEYHVVINLGLGNDAEPYMETLEKLHALGWKEGTQYKIEPRWVNEHGGHAGNYHYWDALGEDAWVSTRSFPKSTKWTRKDT